MHARQAERVTASSAILAMLTGDPATKAEAAWVALVETLRGLKDIVPRTLEFPAPLHGVTVDQLRTALACDPDERAGCAAAFTAFRSDVFRLEAHNSARLGVLIGALRRVQWLRERGYNAATLDRYEAALHGHLFRVWRLSMPPDGVDWRQWCDAQTREYGLFPRAWRVL
jgi:hypothetical protein